MICLKPFREKTEEPKGTLGRIMEGILGCDLRSLALLRMGCALLFLIDLSTRSWFLMAHYTDGGILPRYAVLAHHWNPWLFSIHLANGNIFFQGFLFLSAAICAVALGVGYRTRLVTFLSWIFIISVQARNPFVNQGGDVLFRVIFFWAMFLPWGAKWSLDSLLTSSKSKIPKRILSMGTVGYHMQIVYMYVFAGLSKTGTDWKDGTAIYYALSLDAFVTPIGRWMLNFPQVLEFLTHAVVYFELFGMILFFMPFWTPGFRLLGIISFCFLQFGMRSGLELGPFPWFASFSLLAFIPSIVWEGGFWASWRARAHDRFSGIAIKVLKPINKTHKPLRLLPSRKANFCAAVLVLYTLFWNVGTLPGSIHHVPENIKWLGVMLRLDQEWNMFAQNPFKDDGWFVMPGKLRDGSLVDVFRDGKPVTWDKPRRISKMYPTQRWRKFYVDHIVPEEKEKYRMYLSKYLCRDWNSRNPDDKLLEEFEIFYMMESTPPNYRPPKIEKKSVWKQYCYEVPETSKKPQPEGLLEDGGLL
jgi:hypothetical protein